MDGMTFPFLPNRNPLWTPSNLTARHFFFPDKIKRPSMFSTLCCCLPPPQFPVCCLFQLCVNFVVSTHVHSCLFVWWYVCTQNSLSEQDCVLYKYFFTNKLLMQEANSRCWSNLNKDSQVSMEGGGEALQSSTYSFGSSCSWAGVEVILIRTHRSVWKVGGKLCKVLLTVLAAVVHEQVLK